MGHTVRLFTGPLAALRPFVAATPLVRIYRLSATSPFPVLPLTDDVHEALHAAYGTGDWAEHGPMLTTTDVAFAERASRGAALAYLETDYSGGAGRQSAVAWRHGELVLKPTELRSELQGKRAPSLWPINMALKTLGVTAMAGEDEFTALGLVRWRDTEDIVAAATVVDPGV